MLVRYIVIAVLVILVVGWWQRRRGKRALVIELETRTEAKRINHNIQVDHQVPNILDQTPTQETQEARERLFGFKLMMVSDISEQTRTDVSAILGSFRKPHPLLLPLIISGSQASELFDLVKKDPEMTAKIIKEVNSPFYGVSQSITSINHAINFIGVKQVKQIALQLCIANGGTFSNTQQNAAFNRLWLSSQLASSLCTIIAKFLGEKNISELSTCCLLAYLGDQALLSYRPALASHYQKGINLFERLDYTQKEIALNAAIVGNLLAKQWLLPTSISQNIASSLLPITFISSASTIDRERLKQSVICFIACRLAEYFVDFRQTNIIEQISLSSNSIGGVDFYHIESGIEQAGISKIYDVFTDPSFQQQVKSVIVSLNNS